MTAVRQLGGVAGAAIAVSLAACGGSHSRVTPSRSSTATVRATPAAKPPTVITARTIGRLPAPVKDAAVAALGDRSAALLGGIDQTAGSTDAITVLRDHHAIRRGSLPNAQHDAQATTIGGDVYVFGGGQLSTYDHILRYDPATSAVTQVGTLPAPASDVAVAAVGNTAYVFGGYDGARALDTVIAWRPGARPRVVARLPFGLRYAATASIGDRVIIAGGTVAGGASDLILSFEPSTGAVTRLGRLPAPLTHAAAAVVSGRVLLIGGRHSASGDRTAGIVSIDPASGAVQIIGRLPQPLSDAMAIGGRQLVLAGGETAAGPSSSILSLTVS